MKGFCSESVQRSLGFFFQSEAPKKSSHGPRLAGRMLELLLRPEARRLLAARARARRAVRRGAS